MSRSRARNDVLIRPRNARRSEPRKLRRRKQFENSPLVDCFESKVRSWKIFRRPQLFNCRSEATLYPRPNWTKTMIQKPVCTFVDRLFPLSRYPTTTLQPLLTLLLPPRRCCRCYFVVVNGVIRIKSMIPFLRSSTSAFS